MTSASFYHPLLRKAEEASMKIMVGYDGSNAGREALRIACERAEAFKAGVHVVTSLEKGTQGQSEEIAEAESGLEYAKSLFDDAGVNCQTHLLIRGLTPGEDLVAFAKENGVNEIVVGVRKRSKVGKLLLGSTAQYVILNADCPVVTVR
jgi:nucleotide-binding universal stress UspA family protein